MDRSGGLPPDGETLDPPRPLSPPLPARPRAPRGRRRARRRRPRPRAPHPPGRWPSALPRRRDPRPWLGAFHTATAWSTRRSLPAIACPMPQAQRILSFIPRVPPGFGLEATREARRVRCRLSRRSRGLACWPSSGRWRLRLHRLRPERSLRVALGSTRPRERATELDTPSSRIPGRRQRRHEGHQVVDLALGERERLDVLVRATRFCRPCALVVVVDDIPSVSCEPSWK